MLQIAKEYFGFVTDEVLSTIETDPVSAIEVANSGEHDLILVDIDWHNPNSELREKLLDPEFLAKLESIAVPDGGLIAFNIDSTDKTLLKKVETQLKASLSSLLFAADLVDG